MPPKDVKKAKKLFEKMKKEREAAALAKEEAEKGSATDGGADNLETSESENTEEKDRGDVSSNENAHRVDVGNNPGEADDLEEEEQEADHSTTPESGNQPEPEPKVDTENKEGTRGTSVQSEEAEPTELESTAKDVSDDDTVAISDTIEAKTTATDLESVTSSIKEPIEPALGKLSLEPIETPPPSSGSDAELIAELRQENEDLKLQNQDLKNTIARLEGELSVAKRANLEVSVSPPYPLVEGEDHQASRSRDRSSSFIEAELYSEADKVSARNEQMEKWKGYQLDMRPWQSSRCVGPIVSV